MKTGPLPVNEDSDARLLDRARRGERAAFGQLVARHQTAVASVAYAVCGDFRRSEDVAQETFVAAWPRLGSVADPTKLRAWLCGIARHRALDVVRGARRREAGGDAGTAELPPETASGEPGPREQAIAREESALVWRALERLPENYREPLVLFYREQQSVAAVATALAITEDAVKQRLARGRELLRGEVERVVARTLGYTTPGVLLTTSVLAALPLMLVPLTTVPAAAATPVGLAAKGSAAAKVMGAMPWLGAVSGPLFGALGAWLGTQAALARARSEEEREYVRGTARRIWILVVLFHVVLFGLLAWRWSHPALSTTAHAVLLFSWIAAFTAGVGAVSFRRARGQAKLFPLAPSRVTAPADTTEYRSRWTLGGVPLVHVRFGAAAATGRPPSTARGWIAIGDIARGRLVAIGGAAFAPVAIGGLAVGVVAIGGGACGLLALGGFAAGGWAAGGGALGWFGALGGLAIAREFAWGGFALAAHANDAVVEAWAERHRAVEIARLIGWFGPVAAVLAVIPAWLGVRRTRREAAKRGA